MVNPLIFHVRETQVLDCDYLKDRLQPATIKVLKEALERQGVTLAFEYRPETKKYRFATSNVHATAISPESFDHFPEGWYVSFSTTVFKESFCRKIGRDIATGRLKCRRKDLAYYFGQEKPTFEDAVAIAVLLFDERKPNHNFQLEMK